MAAEKNMQSDMDNCEYSKPYPSRTSGVAISMPQQQCEERDVKPNKNLLASTFGKNAHQRQNAPFVTFHRIQFMCEERANHGIIKKIEHCRDPVNYCALFCVATRRAAVFADIGLF